MTSSRAYKYAQYAAQPDNPKIGRYVRRQAQKWLDICDGKGEGAYIDLKMFRQISNILKIITHPDLRKSMYEGLEDYAMLFIFALFCTMNADGGRYYTTGLLEIARKNFKTFTSAVIFIIAMLTSPRFARFFSVAPDLKLSSELKIALKKIIKSSPALEKHFKVLRSEIRCDITEAEYVPLAYSEDKLDGKLAHIFLADEVGAMGAYPVEAMRSSQITLDDPLGILISTQYPNDDNGLIDEIDFAKKQLDGLYEGMERIFALLFEPDEELIKHWETDDNVIYQANPVAVANDKLFQKLAEKRNLAILYENRRENFLCKHCNIKYQGLGTEGFIDVVKLRECVTDEDLNFWRGRRVWLGLDLSLTEDNTAIAMVTYDDNERVYAKVWGFLPNDRVEIKTAKEKVDYKRHIAAGECFACGDEVIDYGFVERFALSLEETYGVRVVQCGFDRYNAISTAQKLESDSRHPMECVEIKQHSSVLHPATKLLKEKILSGEFSYDRNTLLEINFQNARCREDTNLNKYVDKKRSAGKVDMVVAIINALFLAQLEMLSKSRNFLVQY
ncbi:MAG: terminase [Ruminococcaceae bacterium]|nr:terminase [Oscillospiraceae bacterium]